MRTLRSRLLSGCLLGLLGLLAAALVAAPPVAPGPVAAAPPAPLPAELACVPHDAALFVHADAAAILGSELAKALRRADQAPFARLEDLTSQTFGAKLDDLKSVTLFYPKLKQPTDLEQFGVALCFKKAADRKKLEAGFAKLLPKNAKVKVLAPADDLALVLVGLGEEYGKPQPADAQGHLTAAIRAAATGKHALVVGGTLGSLPDEFQKDDLPGPVRAFQPILKSQAVYATIDLGKSLGLEVRVKAKREADAVEAEKALAALAKLITDQLTRDLPDLEKEAAADAGLKDLVKVFQAALAAAKGAKFGIDGTEARLSATLPLGDLPLISAYRAGVRKVEQAAANQRSANNLKQIAIAMHSYHDANNAMPPAAVCGKGGKPQLSWRVLILPYIEQDNLYKQFKLDEPWDGPNNKKLIAKMPNVYLIPGQKAGATETHYRVFVGNGAGFEYLTGMRLPASFPDGTSNTLMIATAADAVPWTKPDELEYDPEQDPTKLFGLVVNGKAQVAMFDGSVRTLSKLPSKTTLHALITRNGGEVIGNDF